MNGLTDNDSCDTKQIPPIETAVDGIHRELEQLRDCVTTLHGRLSSTMTPEPPSCGEKNVDVKLPEMSPLLTSIKEACGKLKSERHRLSDLLTRMQI